MLFGKDLSAIKTIHDETEKLSWLVPLGKFDFKISHYWPFSLRWNTTGMNCSVCVGFANYGHGGGETIFQSRFAGGPSCGDRADPFLATSTAFANVGLAIAPAHVDSGSNLISIVIAVCLVQFGSVLRNLEANRSCWYTDSLFVNKSDFFRKCFFSFCSRTSS